MYLFLTVEGEKGHRAVGSTGSGSRGHAVLCRLAGAGPCAGLWAQLGSQCTGQVMLHLLPLALLDVVLRGAFQVILNLNHKHRDNAYKLTQIYNFVYTLYIYTYLQLVQLFQLYVYSYNSLMLLDCTKLIGLF